MPNGRAHDIITIITVGIADGVYFRFMEHPQLSLAALFTGTFVFAGFACAGDLDLNSSELRRWGPLKFIWLPYTTLIRHRSLISHGLIIGGIIRALYLGVATTLLFWLSIWLYSRLGPHVNASEATKNQLGSLTHWFHTHRPLAIAGLSGFILAGTVHSIADIVYSAIKKRLPHKRRRSR